MSQPLLLVLVIAALTYVTRCAGFAIGRWGAHRMPPAFERFLAYVPVAAFAAIIAPGVADGPGAPGTRIVSVAAAALVAVRFRRLWAALIVGMLTYWTMDLLIG